MNKANQAPTWTNIYDDEECSVQVEVRDDIILAPLSKDEFKDPEPSTKKTDIERKIGPTPPPKRKKRNPMNFDTIGTYQNNSECIKHNNLLSTPSEIPSVQTNNNESKNHIKSKIKRWEQASQSLTLPERTTETQQSPVAINSRHDHENSNLTKMPPPKTVKKPTDQSKGWNKIDEPPNSVTPKPPIIKDFHHIVENTTENEPSIQLAANINLNESKPKNPKPLDFEKLGIDRTLIRKKLNPETLQNRNYNKINPPLEIDTNATFTDQIKDSNKIHESSKSRIPQPPRIKYDVIENTTQIEVLKECDNEHSILQLEHTLGESNTTLNENTQPAKLKNLNLDFNKLEIENDTESTEQKDREIKLDVESVNVLLNRLSITNNSNPRSLNDDQPRRISQDNFIKRSYRDTPLISTGSSARPSGDSSSGTEESDSNWENDRIDFERQQSSTKFQEQASGIKETIRAIGGSIESALLGSQRSKLNSPSPYSASKLEKNHETFHFQISKIGIAPPSPRPVRAPPYPSLYSPTVSLPDINIEMSTALTIIGNDLLIGEKKYMQLLQDAIKMANKFTNDNVPEKTILKVFGFFEDIYMLHEQLCKELTTQITTAKSIALCFLNYISKFDVYIERQRLAPNKEDLQKLGTNNDSSYINRYLCITQEKIMGYLEKFQILAKNCDHKNELREVEIALTAFKDLSFQLEMVEKFKQIYDPEYKLGDMGRVHLINNFKVKINNQKRQQYLVCFCEKKIIFIKEQNGISTYFDEIRVSVCYCNQRSKSNLIFDIGIIGGSKCCVLKSNSPEIKEEWLKKLKDVLQEEELLDS